jgi:hypothetical protein
LVLLFSFTNARSALVAEVNKTIRTTVCGWGDTPCARWALALIVYWFFLFSHYLVILRTLRDFASRTFVGCCLTIATNLESSRDFMF